MQHAFFVLQDRQTSLGIVFWPQGKGKCTQNMHKWQLLRKACANDARSHKSLACAADSTLACFADLCI